MTGTKPVQVHPEEHPGIVKTDCIVLDFGTSSLIHGTLEQDFDLDGKTDTGDLLPRIAASRDFFECRFCAHAGRCWGLAA